MLWKDTQSTLHSDNVHLSAILSRLLAPPRRKRCTGSIFNTETTKPGGHNNGTVLSGTGASTRHSFVLLPPLLFEDASVMDYYVFRKLDRLSCQWSRCVADNVDVRCDNHGMFGFANECVVRDRLRDWCDGCTDHQAQAEHWRCARYRNTRTEPDAPTYCQVCMDCPAATDQLPISVLHREIKAGSHGPSGCCAAVK